jgi:hypothetical protein
MNTSRRRVLLAATVLIGGYVGLWAEFFTNDFYRSFPGFGLHWIDIDGAFNEHLIRDIGSLYLGLGAGSVAAMISRSALPGRVIGLAWAVFGILHFGYHTLNPKGSPTDIAGSVVSLAISALLGIALVLPVRDRADRAAPIAERAPR